MATLLFSVSAPIVNTNIGRVSSVRFGHWPTRQVILNTAGPTTLLSETSNTSSHVLRNVASAFEAWTPTEAFACESACHRSKVGL